MLARIMGEGEKGEGERTLGETGKDDGGCGEGRQGKESAERVEQSRKQGKCWGKTA